MDNKEFFTGLAGHWAARREGMELKPGSKKELDAQLHFVIGAVQGAKVLGQHNNGMDMIVTMSLALGGRCIVKEFPPALAVPA